MRQLLPMKKDANGNYRADVTGQNAHAWVEIYCDGVGGFPWM